MQTISYYTFLICLSLFLLYSPLSNHLVWLLDKLNLSKSEQFPVNTAAKVYPLHNIPFKVALHSFTYLGFQVTHRIEALYKENFAPFFSRIREDFDQWCVLNTVNTVKMNILPCFSYLFQCIALFLSQSFFFFVNWIVSSYPGVSLE